MSIDETVTDCYSNGVRQQVSLRTAGSDYEAVLTEKRDSTVCFTIRATIKTATDTVIYVFLDGNGRQVATGISNSGEGDVTVTCTGGTPHLLSQACLDVGSFDGDGCSPGVCKF